MNKCQSKCKWQMLWFSLHSALFLCCCMQLYQTDLQDTIMIRCLAAGMQELSRVLNHTPNISSSIEDGVCACAFLQAMMNDCASLRWRYHTPWSFSHLGTSPASTMTWDSSFAKSFVYFTAGTQTCGFPTTYTRHVPSERINRADCVLPSALHPCFTKCNFSVKIMATGKTPEIE